MKKHLSVFGFFARSSFFKVLLILLAMCAVEFDGEKLVMVDRTAEKKYGTLELCGFTVAIYNSTGLVYYGEYESSLSATANPHDYAFNCLPIKYTVSWTE